MADLLAVLGFFLLFYVQGGQCYETCYNYYYAEYYECEHGCCGDWDDVDYGCCTLTGQIVGGVIGGLILIGIIVFVIVFCFVLKKKGSAGAVFGGQRRTVAPQSNVTVVHHPAQPQHQPYGNPGGMQMGQAYPGPPPQQYPGPPQGPPGYGMMPPQPQQYPPPPPPNYDAAYPPKY